MEPLNPCMTCGACCAYFRVSFYWREADEASGGSVPVMLTQPLDDFRRCMRGTDQPQPCCAALEGAIGEAVRCTIYSGRPSPCREFGVDWTDGALVFIPEDLERCTRARAAHGLPPLLDAPGAPPLPGPPDAPDRQAS
jgi:hypothetical protein